MKRYALLKPTELARLAELSEKHEELTQYLADLEKSGAPSTSHPLGSREAQIEIRQLRQETLKLLSEIARRVEGLA